MITNAYTHEQISRNLYKELDDATPTGIMLRNFATPIRKSILQRVNSWASN